VIQGAYVRGNTDLDSRFFQKLGELIVSTSSGRGKVYMALSGGYLYTFNRDFSPDVSQMFTRAITLVHHLKTKNVLLAVGEDDSAGIQPIVRMVNYERLDKNGNPVIKEIRLDKPYHNIPVCYALSVLCTLHSAMCACCAVRLLHCALVALCACCAVRLLRCALVALCACCAVRCADSFRSRQ
jgi:hypothetical protein